MEENQKDDSETVSIVCKRSRKVIKKYNNIKKPKKYIRTPYLVYLSEKINSNDVEGLKYCELREKWNNMEEGEKHLYFDKYIQDKLRYSKQWEEYMSKILNQRIIKLTDGEKIKKTIYNLYHENERVQQKLSDVKKYIIAEEREKQNEEKKIDKVEYSLTAEDAELYDELVRKAQILKNQKTMDNIVEVVQEENEADREKRKVQELMDIDDYLDELENRQTQNRMNRKNLAIKVNKNINRAFFRVFIKKSFILPSKRYSYNF